MKKIIYILSVLSLMAAVLSGCGSKAEEATLTETSGLNDMDDSADEDEDLPDYSFSETVAADNENYSITVTDLDPAGEWGYTIYVSLKNKSENTDYTFSLYTAAVDGVETASSWSVTLSAGEEADDEIYLDTDILDDLEVSYSDIALTFEVYDTESGAFLNPAYETAHIYPYGEENALSYGIDESAAAAVPADDENVSVIVESYETDSEWGEYLVNLYLVNKTEKKLTFSAEDVFVNGCASDPYYTESVDAGCGKTSVMYWYLDDLNADGVTGDVEKIEFSLVVRDYENQSEIILNEKCTLYP